MCLIFPNRNQNWLTRQYFFFLYTFFPSILSRNFIVSQNYGKVFYVQKEKENRKRNIKKKKIDFLKEFKINHATKLIYFIINKILINKIGEHYAFMKRRLFN